MRVRAGILGCGETLFSAWVPALGVANLVDTVTGQPIVDTTATWLPGSQNGTALHFEKASSQNVQTNNDVWPSGGNYSFAVGARIDSTASGNVEHTLFSNLTAPGTGENHDISGLSVSTSGTTYHHWMGTVNGDTFTLYQDGIQVGQATISTGNRHRIYMRFESDRMEFRFGDSGSKGNSYFRKFGSYKR